MFKHTSKIPQLFVGFPTKRKNEKKIPQLNCVIKKNPTIWLNDKKIPTIELCEKLLSLFWLRKKASKKFREKKTKYCKKKKGKKKMKIQKIPHKENMKIGSLKSGVLEAKFEKYIFGP